MHQLKVPDPPAGRGVEADQRLRVKPRALSATSVPVVRGSAHRQIEQPARGVDGEWGPDVGVADPLSRARFPRLRPGLVRAGHRIPAPYPAPGAHVECLQFARRGAVVDQPVGYGAADDHEIPPDDRRGGVAVMEPVDRPAQIPGEVYPALVAEGADRAAGRGIERPEIPAGVEEDPALAGARPDRHAPMHERGMILPNRAEPRSPWIELPEQI